MPSVAGSDSVVTEASSAGSTEELLCTLASRQCPAVNQVPVVWCACTSSSFSAGVNEGLAVSAKWWFGQTLEAVSYNSKGVLFLSPPDHIQ